LVSAVTAAIGFSSNASASLYPEFTVNEGVVLGAASNSFTANKISGTYSEIITFDPGFGTFSVDLRFDAATFSLLPSVGQPALTQPDHQLGKSILNPSQYSLYALYNGTGTYSQSAGGASSFSFTPNSGTLAIYIDPTPEVQNDPDLTKLVATGVPTFGQGTLDPTLGTCQNGGINCGSFGATTTLELTDFGKTYFTAPTSFYSFSFQSGDLNNFQVGLNQKITGSLNVVFGNAVPEPASIALVGLGLLGVAASRRKRK
jgi:hypothetical protein